MKQVSSLSWQIIKEVVFIYGFVALFLTSFQLWIDYKENLKAIEKNLSSSYEMFGPPLSEAFYHVNTNMMEEIFKGVLSQSDFLGVAVYDHLADEFITRGQVGVTIDELKPYLKEESLCFELEDNSGVIAYQHALKIQGNIGEEKYFGNLIVFSNTQLAFERIENTIVIVFINSLIKAIVLVTMFLLIFNRLLIQPLTKINDLISNLTSNNLKSLRLDLKITNSNELHYLQTGFNQLLDDLYQAQEKERILQNQSKFIALGEMVGNIAHQWRQPLGTVNMVIVNLLTRMEQSKLENEYLGKKLKTIEELNLYMSNTIEDFLSFTKPNKSIETFYIKDAVESSLEIVKSKIKKHNITTTLNLPKESTLTCNKQELMQVLIVLISNGIDSVIESKDSKRKEIEIKLHDKNDYVEINIKDYGKGITKEIIERIFEPYFTSKEKEQGVGLGLYIAKMIVEKSLKGTIDATNHKDGAIFTVTIPKSSN